MIIKKFKRSNKKRRIQTFFIITNFFGFLEETEEMFEQEELRDSSKRRKDIKMAYEIFKYFAAAPPFKLDCYGYRVIFCTFPYTFYIL